ncbi:hypothetical protein [[Clostridium] innocuum]|uniref:hypothetical protein n=1 Tax=Clostridium innocuum TaxID=1522 RepID=UPI00300DACC1
MECGYVQMCPNCETAMSYHKEEGVLKCHICDSVMLCQPIVQAVIVLLGVIWEWERKAGGVYSD